MIPFTVSDLMRRLRVTTPGESMPYRRLLQWIGEDPQRAELARRAINYKRHWARKVIEEAAS